MPRRTNTGDRGITAIMVDGEKRYRIRARLNGREVSRLARVDNGQPAMTKGDARAAHRKLLAELDAGTFKPLRGATPATGTALTLSDAFKVYLAWCASHRPKTHSHRADLTRVWIKAVGDVKLAEFGPLTVRRFVASREADGVEGATVNRGLTMVKHMIGLADAEGWGWPISAEHVKQIRAVKLRRENPPIERFLTNEERANVLARCPADLRPYVYLAVETGMRRGEILALRRADVDLVRSELRIGTSKNGKPRVLPISAVLAPVLRASLDAADDDNVFPVWAPRERRRGGKRPTGCAIGHAWATCRASLGIADTGFRFHDLRHDFATRKLRAGVPVHLISRFLGHSDISITLKRYAHIVTSDLAIVVTTPDAPGWESDGSKAATPVAVRPTGTRPIA